MAPRYKRIDTTLREGEQTPGVCFTLEQKKRIIDGLVSVGIDEIEVGLAAAVSEYSRHLARYCQKHYPHLQVSAWSRCRKEDMEHASLIQPDILSLSIPVSDLHLDQKLGKSRLWARQTLVESVRLAHQIGAAVSIGFEDATRADTDFLMSMAELAEQEGVRRIRITDTVGIGSPTKIGELIQSIAGVLTVAEIGIHTHNDFGMASANAVTALENGATWADGTILGLGERTGCAWLEELVGFLQLNCGCSHLNISALNGLAGHIAEITSRLILPNQPLLGEDIFSCETGLHLQGLIADPQTYEPFAPEMVGARRKLIFGGKIGRRALKHWFEQSGQEPSRESTISDERLLHYRRQLQNRANDDIQYSLS